MSPLKKESPLYGILALPEEDNGYDAIMERKIKTFTSLKIKEIYGLTFDEFFDRPRQDVNALIKGAQEYLASKQRELEEQASMLEELTNPQENL